MTMIPTSDLTDEVFDHFERETEAEKVITIQGDAIVIALPDSFTYDIPLRECETIHGVLQWIEHMREKTWMTDEMLSRLIALIDQHNEGR